MTDRAALDRRLNQLLEPARFKDYGPNGLQVEGRAEVRHLVCGVTASLALIDAAIAAGEDAILVHHGLFWRGQDGRVTGWMKQRLARLIQHDINLAMVTNHMHTYGTSAYSELVRQDGTKTMLVTDEQWLAEEQFNPKYQRFSVSTPMQAHAGDTFHTHCEWNNTTTSPKLFPDEMCAGVGFYFPGNGQITCENGGWGM